MLMEAFKAVQMVYELQSSVGVEPVYETLHNRLLQAVTVYRTNGENDSPAIDAQRMINAFRTDKRQPPSSPSGSPTIAA